MFCCDPFRFCSNLVQMFPRLVEATLRTWFGQKRTVGQVRTVGTKNVVFGQKSTVSQWWEIELSFVLESCSGLKDKHFVEKKKKKKKILTL